VTVLKLIENMPEGVVGVEADDKITAEDYEQVLEPAIEAARDADGKVRLLYVLGHDFPDYSAGAAWEDAKLGLGHLRSWERIAIVSDADWLHRAIHGLGWLMPGEVRIFRVGELDAAREWVASQLPEGERFF
jgi:SpoIIAA-like